MVITDPGPPTKALRIEPWALRYINDARDVPFLFLATKLTLLIVPAACAFFAAPTDHFPWWGAAIYWAMLLYYAGPYNLMLHNTSHRAFFKKQYPWANRYIPWFIGPFFGHAPDSYFIHHVGMHHPENNLETDLSTTLPYQRDSIVSFAAYYWAHISGVFVRLPIYLHRKHRMGMRNTLIVSLAFYYSAQLLLLSVNWRATLVVFVAPYFIMHLLMMCGNWGQHAFIDLATPDNCHRNSITCINSVYNQRCFNDGYHIGHHLKATRHWTEMPKEFLDNKHIYAAERAIVFHTLDFFMVWGCLMLKRYNWLAKYYVELDGMGRSPAQIETLLRERTARAPAHAHVANTSAA